MPRDRTFANFVVVPSNREAHDAAVAFCADNSRANRLLFIVGEPAVGKSHLLHAIATQVRSQGSIAEDLLAEKVWNEFRCAAAAGRVSAWLARYSAVRMLLVDSLEHYSGFSVVRLIEEIHQLGGACVCAAIRPLHERSSVHPRLKGAILQGQQVRIREPTSPEMEGILTRIATSLGLIVTPEKIKAVARNARRNVRRGEALLR